MRHVYLAIKKLQVCLEEKIIVVYKNNLKNLRVEQDWLSFFSQVNKIKCIWKPKKLFQNSYSDVYFNFHYSKTEQKMNEFNPTIWGAYKAPYDKNWVIQMSRKKLT